MLRIAKHFLQLSTMEFEVKKEDPYSSARTGCFTTAHGVINTPIFMPVGTRGTVKGIHQWELAGGLFFRYF